MCVALMVGSPCELPLVAVDWEAARAVAIVTDETPQRLFVEEVPPGRVVRRCFDAPWVYEIGTWPEGCACEFRIVPELLQYLDDALSRAGELQLFVTGVETAQFEADFGPWGETAFLGSDKPINAADPLELGALDHDRLQVEYDLPLETIVTVRR